MNVKHKIKKAINIIKNVNNKLDVLRNRHIDNLDIKLISKGNDYAEYEITDGDKIVRTEVIFLAD